MVSRTKTMRKEISLARATKKIALRKCKSNVNQPLAFSGSNLLISTAIHKKIKMVEKLLSERIGVTRDRLYCLLENSESLSTGNNQ